MNGKSLKTPKGEATVHIKNNFPDVVISAKGKVKIDFYEQEVPPASVSGGELSYTGESASAELDVVTDGRMDGDFRGKFTAKDSQYKQIRSSQEQAALGIRRNSASNKDVILTSCKPKCVVSDKPVISISKNILFAETSGKEFEDFLFGSEIGEFNIQLKATKEGLTYQLPKSIGGLTAQQLAKQAASLGQQLYMKTDCGQNKQCLFSLENIKGNLQGTTEISTFDAKKNKWISGKKMPALSFEMPKAIGAQVIFPPPEDFAKLQEMNKYLQQGRYEKLKGLTFKSADTKKYVQSLIGIHPDSFNDPNYNLAKIAKRAKYAKKYDDQLEKAYGVKFKGGKIVVPPDADENYLKKVDLADKKIQKDMKSGNVNFYRLTAASIHQAKLDQEIYETLLRSELEKKGDGSKYAADLQKHIQAAKQEYTRMTKHRKSMAELVKRNEMIEFQKGMLEIQKEEARLENMLRQALLEEQAMKHAESVKQSKALKAKAKRIGDARFKVNGQLKRAQDDLSKIQAQVKQNEAALKNAEKFGKYSLNPHMYTIGNQILRDKIKKLKAQADRAKLREKRLKAQINHFDTVSLAITNQIRAVNPELAMQASRMSRSVTSAQEAYKHLKAKNPAKANYELYRAYYSEGYESQAKSVLEKYSTTNKDGTTNVQALAWRKEMDHLALVSEKHRTRDYIDKQMKEYRAKKESITGRAFSLLDGATFLGEWGTLGNYLALYQNTVLSEWTPKGFLDLYGRQLREGGAKKKPTLSSSIDYSKEWVKGMLGMETRKKYTYTEKKFEGELKGMKMLRKKAEAARAVMEMRSALFAQGKSMAEIDKIMQGGLVDEKTKEEAKRLSQQLYSRGRKSGEVSKAVGEFYNKKREQYLIKTIGTREINGKKVSLSLGVDVDNSEIQQYLQSASYKVNTDNYRAAEATVRANNKKKGIKMEDAQVRAMAKAMVQGDYLLEAALLKDRSSGNRAGEAEDQYELIATKYPGSGAALVAQGKLDSLRKVGGNWASRKFNYYMNAYQHGLTEIGGVLDIPLAGTAAFKAGMKSVQLLKTGAKALAHTKKFNQVLNLGRQGAQYGAKIGVQVGEGTGKLLSASGKIVAQTTPTLAKGATKGAGVLKEGFVGLYDLGKSGGELAKRAAKYATTHQIYSSKFRGIHTLSLNPDKRAIKRAVIDRTLDLREAENGVKVSRDLALKYGDDLEAAKKAGNWEKAAEASKNLEDWKQVLAKDIQKKEKAVSQLAEAKQAEEAFSIAAHTKTSLLFRDLSLNPAERAANLEKIQAVKQTSFSQRLYCW